MGTALLLLMIAYAKGQATGQNGTVTGRLLKFIFKPLNIP
jgi:hypothetical protein